MRAWVWLGLVLIAAGCGDESDVTLAPADVEGASARIRAPIANVAIELDGIAIESVPDPHAEARALGWLAPLQGRITTPFGDREDGSAHDAIDIAAPMGTEVIAPADLLVRTIAYQTRAGRYLTADVIGEDGTASGDGYRLTFAHLSHVDAVEGQRIEAGTMLGLVGLSGTATGPHLHLRVERVTRTEDGTVRTAIDPLTVLFEADIAGAIAP